MAKYKFNFTKNHGAQDWREHFLLHVMSEKTKNDLPDGFEKTFDLKNSRNEEGDLVLEVEVKVNGVDVPFDSFIKHIEKQFGKMVEERAKELMKEHMSPVHDALHELEHEIKCKTRHLFPGYGGDD
jgi:hypothetical protein